jgi:hypothetical protein
VPQTATIIFRDPGTGSIAALCSTNGNGVYGTSLFPGLFNAEVTLTEPGEPARPFRWINVSSQVAKDFVMEPSFDIGGGISKKDGTPARNTLIVFYSPARNQMVTAMTDQNGDFGTRLIGGEYIALVLPTAETPLWESKSLQVKGDSNFQVIMGEIFSICGRLVDEPGAPLPGTRVEALIPGIKNPLTGGPMVAGLASTDANGEFCMAVPSASLSTNALDLIDALKRHILVE